MGTVLMVSVPAQQSTHSMIVQGKNLAAAKLAVEAAGGTISHELGVIRGVAVELTDTQMAILKSTPGIIRVFDNAAVETAKASSYTLTDSISSDSIYTFISNGLNTDLHSSV